MAPKLKIQQEEIRMFKVGDKVVIRDDAANRSENSYADFIGITQTVREVTPAADSSPYCLLMLDQSDGTCAYRCDPAPSRGEYFMYGVTGVEPDDQEDIERSYEETNGPMAKELYRACRSADGKWVIEAWREITYVIATARDETEADFIADALNHKYSK